VEIRAKVRRECADEDRLLEFIISVDGFEDFYSAVELEGCESPNTFDFPQNIYGSGLHIRLPGDYTVAARLQPSGFTAYTSMEIR